MMNSLFLGRDLQKLCLNNCKIGKWRYLLLLFLDENCSPATVCVENSNFDFMIWPIGRELMGSKYLVDDELQY